VKHYFGKITAMALTAAIVFTALCYAQDQPQPVPQKQRGDAAGGKWKDALDLTPDQEAKLQAFREARQRESEEFRAKMRKLQTEFREVRNDPKADRKKIDGLIDEMAKLRADRMKGSFRNQDERKKIFTPEQLEKMKDFGERLRDALPRMRRTGAGRFNVPERMMGRARFGLGRLQGLRPRGRLPFGRGLMRGSGRSRSMRRRW